MWWLCAHAGGVPGPWCGDRPFWPEIRPLTPPWATWLCQALSCLGPGLSTHEDTPPRTPKGQRMAALRTQGRDCPDAHMDNNPRPIKNKPVPPEQRQLTLPPPHTQTPPHMHTPSHTHTHTFTHTYTSTDVHTLAHAYTSTHSHTPHMHTLSHTHLHTDAHTQALHSGAHTRHPAQARTTAWSRPREPPRGGQAGPSPSNTAGATQQLMRTGQLRPQPPPPHSPCATPRNT